MLNEHDPGVEQCHVDRLPCIDIASEASVAQTVSAPAAPPLIKRVISFQVCDFTNKMSLEPAIMESIRKQLDSFHRSKQQKDVHDRIMADMERVVYGNPSTKQEVLLVAPRRSGRSAKNESQI